MITDNAHSVIKKRPFVILDRDGTLILQHNYLSNPDQVELIPGTGSGLLRLKKLGFGLIVVTNQSGLGRGYFDRKQMDKVHQRINNLLGSEGVLLDGIYVCPHIPEDRCTCRKPEIGMIEQAENELGLDPIESYLIGDNWSDIECGNRLDIKTFLVRTGYGKELATDPRVKPYYIVDDLYEASLVIQELVGMNERT